MLCKMCGNTIGVKRRKVFCSDECKSEHGSKQHAELNHMATADRSQNGAMSEMYVIADLLSKGYQVYRAISGAAPVDLVAWKDEVLVKVEVKTGRKSITGNIRYTTPSNKLYDILAVVIDTQVIYMPKLQ